MSKDTVKKLMQDKDNPFPIAMICGQWVTSENLLIKYFENTIEKQTTKKELAKDNTPLPSFKFLSSNVSTSHIVSRHDLVGTHKQLPSVVKSST